MTPEQKSLGKTLGIVALAAGLIGRVTYLVLPSTMVNPKAFKSSNNPDSNFPIVYEWSYKDKIQDAWRFHSFTTNSTKLVVDATNGQRFFSITAYFLTELPAWVNTNQFYWKRTNK